MQKRHPNVTNIFGDFELRGLLGPPGLDNGFLVAPNRPKPPGVNRSCDLVGRARS